MIPVKIIEQSGESYLVDANDRFYTNQNGYWELQPGRLTDYPQEVGVARLRTKVIYTMEDETCR